MKHIGINLTVKDAEVLWLAIADTKVPEWVFTEEEWTRLNDIKELCCQLLEEHGVFTTLERRVNGKENKNE